MCTIITHTRVQAFACIGLDQVFERDSLWDDCLLCPSDLEKIGVMIPCRLRLGVLNVKPLYFLSSMTILPCLPFLCIINGNNWRTVRNCFLRWSLICSFQGMRHHPFLDPSHSSSPGANDTLNSHRCLLAAADLQAGICAAAEFEA